MHHATPGGSPLAPYEHRLAALEASNRRLRRTGAALALVAAAGVPMAAGWQQPGDTQASPAPQVLRASRVEIVDDRGIVIASLGGTPVENGMHETRQVGALLLSDHPGGDKGTLRTMQIAARTGILGGVEVVFSPPSPGASAQGGHSTPHISFSVDQLGSAVQLSGGATGQPDTGGSGVSVSCGEFPSMQFFDAKGLRRAVLGVDHATGSAAYSLLNDPKNPDVYTWRAAR